MSQQPYEKTSWNCSQYDESAGMSATGLGRSGERVAKVTYEGQWVYGLFCTRRYIIITLFAEPQLTWIWLKPSKPSKAGGYWLSRAIYSLP